MRIYILRHGAAEDRRPRKADAARKLTAAGKEKLIRVLERARQAGVEPSLILTSPHVRAVQTAELAADMLKHEGKPATSEALAPDSTPQRLWEEIRSRKNEKALLLSGHEPHLSTSAAYLLGAAPLSIDLKKGALLCLDIDGVEAEPKGVLKWMLTPGVC